MDLNKIVKDGGVPHLRLPWESGMQSLMFSYYHWERIHMPFLMSHSVAWKRRKVLKGNWSKP